MRKKYLFILKMITKIKKYLSLVKFSHTIFAMPFAIIGFFLGVEHYALNYVVFVLIILCMIFARNSAMAFNRFIDRKYDILNPRTATREIPAGAISPFKALIFVIFNSMLFIVTTFFINKLVFLLSPVALFVVLFYSYTKRFTALCHFVLGIGLSLAPIGAYLSVTGEFALLPVLFSCIVLLWVSGFDIIYALQDYDFDKSEHLNSIPVMLGKTKARFLSIVLHCLVVIILIFTGIIWDFGILFWIGATIFSGLLAYQHSLVRADDLSKIGLAFGTTNGIASVIFCIFVVSDLILS